MLLFINSPTLLNLSSRPILAHKAQTSVCVNCYVLRGKEWVIHNQVIPLKAPVISQSWGPSLTANWARHKGTLLLFRYDRAPLFHWQSHASLQIMLLGLGGSAISVSASGRGRGANPICLELNPLWRAAKMCGFVPGNPLMARADVARTNITLGWWRLWCAQTETSQEDVWWV